LGKSRATTGQRGEGGRKAPPHRKAASPGVSRKVAEPQLHITAPMREQLGLTLDGGQDHQRLSEYRHIKRQVLADLRSQAGQRTVMVASALAGDGKSFTAANLAHSLAREPDHSVLLVDADVVKPYLSRTLGLAERPGLMDALVDPLCEAESLVVSTDIEGLSVLPAGSSCANAPEYFGSERMRAVLEQLQAVPDRIVVIDSLPLLQTTEARALVPLVAQVLMVVRAETTPQGAVQQALALLGEEANVKLVLNAVVRTRLTRYFGYGYGYEYDYANRK
jgi:receptor protein-tyrosine kinase